jgi:hypothetical protein
MATLRIHQTLADLAATTPAAFTAGSAVDQMRAAARELVVENLPLIDGGSLSPAARQGLVTVLVELGEITPLAPSGDVAGFIDVDIRVTIPDDLAYDFTDEASPCSTFITNLEQGLGSIFPTLDGFEEFSDLVGIGSATVAVNTSVILGG